MIYLDNAATTYPKPASVVKTLSGAMRLYGANPGRSGHSMSVKTAEKIFTVRKSLAEMFEAGGPENVCFTLNCSYALNMAIKGIVKKGDHVLTTDLEHNAVMRPLYTLKDRGYITYDTVSTFGNTDDEIIDNFRSKINVKTSCIVCTCMSNVTGSILPVEKIGKLCREYRLKFIVDGAQGAGIIPISVKKMNIDCLCIPGHKGLYGPMGTGVLILGNECKLSTIIEGGTGNMSFSLMQPDDPPDRFESGTQNAVGIIALGAGVNFVKKKGMWHIEQYEMRLARKLYKYLSSINRVDMYTPLPSSDSFGPVISFNVSGLTSEKTGVLLNEAGIAVRAGLHCAPAAHKTIGTLDTGTVRASVSVFNNDSQIEYTAEKIREISLKN